MDYENEWTAAGYRNGQGVLGLGPGVDVEMHYDDHNQDQETELMTEIANVILTGAEMWGRGRCEGGCTYISPLFIFDLKL